MTVAEPRDRPARRFAFDDGLVFRDGGSGRIWLLRGEAAEACSPLADGDVVELLDEIDAADRPTTHLAGRRWQAPGHAPALDRLLSGNGAVLRVRVWDARLARVLDRMLAPLATAGEPASTLDLVVRDGRATMVVDGRIAQDALGLGWWVLIRQLAKSLHPGRTWLGVLHAATVIEADQAIAIAGVSGSGKTTLAGALIATGARLLADDATPIEAGTRLVWPCPLAMGVKQGGWRIFAARFADFSETAPVHHGGRSIRYYPAPRTALGRGYPVKALIFPTWSEGASFGAEPLRPSEALSLLAASGMMPPDADDGLADLLGWLGQVPAWRLRYSGLEDAVSFTRRLFRDAPARAS
ncbi:hypothetical protein [Amaricoccus sp. W119]|uniref:hypothetical protein n=1 Tax=Amaricoccus sp. W119 TaxID=3391833 RepID=UPI0039A586A3